MEELNIIDLYKKGFSINEIHNYLNVSKEKIRKILKSNNIIIVNKQNIPNCSNEDILKLYKSGVSITKISKKFKTDRTRISKILVKNGIIIENFQNKTKFDEHIFDIIDTEEKAYWLGFIFADGYISSSPLDPNKKSRYNFELSLKLSDRTHLNKFNKFMKYNGDNIKLDNKRKRCRWSIVNKHLWITLNNLGCIPNKSLVLKFPDKNIFKSLDLIIHFIRGYFDGDGCISYGFSDKNKTNVIPVCLILGTKDFLSELSLQIGKIGRLRKTKNIYALYFSKNQTINFLNKIYFNSSIYLDRKFKRSEFFITNCRSNQKWLELLAKEIEESI